MSKIMRLRWLTLLLIIFLGGCSYSSKMNKKVSTWIGRTKSDLIQKWGTPSNVYPLIGNRNELYYRDYKPPYNSEDDIYFRADSTGKIDSAWWFHYKHGRLD